MPEDAGHIAALAAAARRIFVYHTRIHEERRTGTRCYYGSKAIPQWDGGVDRGGRRHAAIWPKIAKVALENRADLSEFIAAQFALAPPGRPPRPNQLLGAAAVARYRSHLGDASRDEARRLRIQHDQLALATSQYALLFRKSFAEAARMVLRDPTASLSALYRYCVAAKTGEHGIAGEFRDRAIEQYLGSPAGYRGGWGTFLPAELVREAETYIARLTGVGRP